MQSSGVNPDPPHSATEVFARSRGRTFRVNPPGTYAETGGIDGNQLVLQISRRGRSRLALYDLSTRRLRYLPGFVNDGAWLWRPDLDGGRVLYGAIVPGKATTLSYEIRLADLNRRRIHVLERLDAHAVYAAPGQLRGDWATWLTCPDNDCHVRREDLSSGRVEDAANDLSHPQFGPTVDARGTVYYGRSNGTCSDSEIRRWDGMTDSEVLRLRDGYAFQYAYLAKNRHTLFFDLTGCGRTARSDVYETNVR